MKKLPSIMRILIFLQTLVFTTLFSTIVVANTVTASEQNNLVREQVIESVENYVLQHLSDVHGEGVEVKAMPIDSRIDIPKCPSPLIFKASDEALKQSNVTVKAMCPEKDWYLYMVVKAMQMQEVVILTSAVSPGTLLTAENVTLVKRDKKRLRTSTFGDINSVIGARLKRRSRAGQPVVPNQLCFVCKGDDVLITADIKGLEIKTKGIAQQDGNVGDTIAVRNSNSQKLIRGRVTDVNKVSVRI